MKNQKPVSQGGSMWPQATHTALPHGLLGMVGAWYPVEEFPLEVVPFHRELFIAAAHLVTGQLPDPEGPMRLIEDFSIWARRQGGSIAEFSNDQVRLNYSSVRTDLAAYRDAFSSSKP